MQYQNIEEIYTANDQIREKLKAVIGNLSEEQANNLPEGEKWSVAQIVEHIAKVEVGMTQISAKLLSEAQKNGGKSDGKAVISKEFLEKAKSAATQKLEAPERVRPEGGKMIADSLNSLSESRRKLYELKPLFEEVECSGHKFPHPAFGDLTAHEWLALIGGHEMRHLAQIKRLLAVSG